VVQNQLEIAARNNKQYLIQQLLNLVERNFDLRRLYVPAG